MRKEQTEPKWKTAQEVAEGIPKDLREPRRGRVRDHLFHNYMYISSPEGYSHISELGLPPEKADKLADEIAELLMHVPNLGLILPDLDPEAEEIVL
jgi:hypothetical protein